MTEIKICGITSLEDAMAAAEAGADAMGFIFYPASPRFVTPERAGEIIRGLKSPIVKVGVFVNQDPREVEEIMRYCRLDMIQLHGDESPGYCGRFRADSVIKALSGWAEGDNEPWLRYKVRAFLLDAKDPSLYGGTGRKADWGLARELGRRHPLILSGGLNAANVCDAIAAVSPAAVDFNSGVELSPGRKDHEKVGEVVRLVRSMGHRDQGRVFAAVGGTHDREDA